MTMKVFGSYSSNHGPYQTWEADYIQWDTKKNVVEIYRFSENAMTSNDLVAAVKLQNGWSVSEVSATKIPGR